MMSTGETSLISPGLRSSARSRVEPAARIFGRLGLTPNALTVTGLLIAVIAGVAAANQAWLAAGILVALGGTFDVFDGALARATGNASKFGAFLDSTLDRVGEAVVYIGILAGLQAAGYLDGQLVAAAAMAAAFMVSYTRAKSESLGFESGTGMGNIGLAPREVRIAILTVGLVIAGIVPGPYVPESGAQGAGGFSYPTSWLVLIASLALITVLATITTIQRTLAIRVQAQAETHSEESR